MHFTAVGADERNERMTAGSTTSTERQHAAKNSRCWCGAPLPPPRATGRPRISCSLPCAHGRVNRMRKARRVVEAIEAWRAQAGAGNYPRAHIREEVGKLREELADLERQLRGGRR